MALDLGKPIFVLKLDIRKAFDSDIQARLGEFMFDRIAVRGDALGSKALLIQTDGETLQSNSPMEYGKALLTHQSCLQGLWGRQLDPLSPWISGASRES